MDLRHRQTAGASLKCSTPAGPLVGAQGSGPPGRSLVSENVPLIPYPER